MLSNIKKNITPESLRDLYRLNLLFTGFVFLCSLFFLLLFEDKKVTVVMTLKSGTYMFVVSFMLTYILRYCARRFADNLFLFRFWRFGLSYVLGISLYLLFWHVFASIAGILSRSNGTRWQLTYVMVAVIITTIILFLHDFVITRRAKIQTDLEYSRLQMKNMEAENLLLRQQIHPHFLFNALNTLKALIKSNPEMGEHYLIQLAEFLRVAISHNKQFTATLEEELSVCKNYLEMQQIRFGAAIEWELIIENTEQLKGQVPSFSLQPLLENAIKHNALAKQAPLKIIIRQQGAFISVSNNINSRVYGDASIKSGLSNLAERYFLLTGEEISVKNDGITFTISFKIIANENSYH